MSDRTLSMSARSIAPELMVGASDDDWDHDSWVIELSYQDRTMTLKFHTGSGLRPRQPNIGDILSSLASDASGALNARNFEDWCSEYGYDADSRRAEKTYNAVLAQLDELRNLLGEEDLNVLVFEAPDDGDWSEFEGTSIELPEPE